MQFDCSAIALSCRRYGEGAAIVHLYTAELGRIAAYVHGGASRRQAAIWQAGALVSCHYTSRLPSQLPQVSGETMLETAAFLMDRPAILAMVNALAALIDQALPEGEPQPDFFAETVSTLVALTRGQGDAASMAYLRWECALLQAAGFGLDLSSCAVTGVTENLIYVSPKSGRAVCADAAGKWRDRLLPLPGFMLTTSGGPSDAHVTARDIRDGARLTEYFLAQHVFGARHLPIPSPRQLLQDRLEKAASDGPGTAENTSQD